MQPTGDSYPAQFTFDPPERIDNWRPLVQWLLAIPQLFIMTALGWVSQILAFISWFAILFTGALPESFANFQAMYLRYYLRVNTYAGFLRDEYPPFTFDMTTSDPGNDPRVRVDFRPELANRNRVTVGFRFILAIPQIIALFVLMFASAVCTFIAFFAVLFTAHWPQGLRDFVVSVSRYWVRVEAYLLLLTDEYPPFALT